MDNIRITSGIFRGRSIASPKSNLTHPMGSREKLALFNLISDFLAEATVLDAYAGSGALGIEALSRGAKTVDFIEKTSKIAQTITNNLNSLNINNARVINIDVDKFDTTKQYDIILADPPYDNFRLNSIIRLTKYLKNGGILVLSHPSSAPDIPDLKLTKTRKYATANITIYQK